MSTVINTNVASLHSQRQLQNVAKVLETPTTRVSSGLRLAPTNNDVPFVARAGVSEELLQAHRNVSAAENVAQTAQEGLILASNLLHQMRDLTVLSLNGVNTAGDGDTLNEGFSRLKAELFRVTGSVSLDDQKLLEVDTDGAKQIKIGTAQLNLNNIALINNGNPEDGILTRSDDRVSLTSAASDISGSSSQQQRRDVLNSLDKMISDVRTAMYAVGAFYGEVSSDLDSIYKRDDLGLYTPIGSRAPEQDVPSEAVKAREHIQQQIDSSVLAQGKFNTQMSINFLRV